MANDLNQTPSANRIHIGFFGRRNAGKSSLVNAVTGQDLSIVSEVRGTTTDPVNKAMELLPLGPVVIIDTPGIDDEGDLGALRVNRAYRILNKTDIAVLVVDAASGMQPEDRAMLKKIQDKKIPHVVVYNKSDLAGPAGEEKPRSAAETAGDGPEAVISVSALTGANIRELKEMIAAQAKHLGNENRIIH